MKPLNREQPCIRRKISAVSSTNVSAKCKRGPIYTGSKFWRRRRYICEILPIDISMLIFARRPSNSDPIHRMVNQILLQMQPSNKVATGRQSRQTGLVHSSTPLFRMVTFIQLTPIRHDQHRHCKVHQMALKLMEICPGIPRWV